MSAKEGRSTGTLNSVVFHTNSEVDFGFAAISDTASSDVAMAMCVTVCDRGETGKWVQLFTLIHSF